MSLGEVMHVQAQRNRFVGVRAVFQIAFSAKSLDMERGGYALRLEYTD